MSPTAQKVYTISSGHQRQDPRSQLPTLNLPPLGHHPHQHHQQFYTVHPETSNIGTQVGVQRLPPIKEQRDSTSAMTIFEPSSSLAYPDSRPEPEIPAKRRSCHDCIFAMLFIAFIGFLAYVISDVVVNGKARPAILLSGYDNYGNICGQDNEAIPSVDYSGSNMSGKPFLMITLHENVTIRTTCVANCPRSEFLLTAFNRCLPRKSPIKLPLMLLDAFNVSRTVLEAVVSDTVMCWKEITYSASISFVFSLIVLILLRYVAVLVIWTSLIGLTIVSALGVTYVWLKWNIAKSRLVLMTTTNVLRLSQQKTTEQWFMGAITCSMAWVIFVLLLLIMRKRIQLAARLFHEAGKAIGGMPFLLLQPFWTFAVLLVTCGLWLFGLVYLQSTRTPLVDTETHFVSYHLSPFFNYMKWYHMFAIIWTVHFILACQHFVIASSVVRWYFARLKSDLASPIAKSYAILIRYHLGSIALGSLFVASVKMTRMMFKRMETILTKYQSSCSLLAKCCHCCLWIFEKVLIFINRNVYIEIAIYGKSFYASAQRSFSVISSNALRVAAVNSVGDFLLFLGKLSIVLMTLFVGAKLVEDKEQRLTYSWAPLLVSGVSAYFVSHCFLSVYEMAIDTLLICFCEDCSMNDGLSKPYFMSSALLTFVQSQEDKNEIRAAKRN